MKAKKKNKKERENKMGEGAVPEKLQCQMSLSHKCDPVYA